LSGLVYSYPGPVKLCGTCFLLCFLEEFEWHWNYLFFWCFTHFVIERIWVSGLNLGWKFK
jgi:hypothetical protein